MPNIKFVKGQKLEMPVAPPPVVTGTSDAPAKQKVHEFFD
jgi:hypothetical protein